MENKQLHAKIKKNRDNKVCLIANHACVTRDESVSLQDNEENIKQLENDNHGRNHAEEVPTNCLIDDTCASMWSLALLDLCGLEPIKSLVSMAVETLKKLEKEQKGSKELEEVPTNKIMSHLFLQLREGLSIG